MNSVVLTNLIAEFHQLLNALLVGMVLLPVLEADRVQHQVAVDMLAVDVSCYNYLVIIERFLRKLHRNFVCEFGLDLISTREALHQMIVQPPVRLVVEILGCGHLIESSLGRAVDSCHESLVLRDRFLLSADIVEDIFHSASGLSFVVDEMDDRHYLTSLAMSQTAAVTALCCSNSSSSLTKCSRPS